jgi:hypothetical protein
MATGGIFTLLTNDGKQDKLLLASDMLKRRLDAVSAEKSAAGIADTSPTILDIEQTHVFFMVSHYKPQVAVGFEYNKVRPTGSVVTGNEVIFSIPQFGDFFSDMAAHIIFNQVIYTPTTTVAGNKLLFRYCDYPGERVFDYSRFEVNSNTLDDYDQDAYTIYRQYRLAPGKVHGYKILMGQEVPVDCFVQQYAQPGVQSSNRVKLEYYEGFQTPAAVQPALELMVPLMFPWNMDPRLAIPSVAIPYGQRFVKLTLTAASNLVEQVTPVTASTSLGALDLGVLPALTVSSMSLYINNIFVNPEIHDIFIKRIGFTLIRVHRFHRIRVTNSTDELLLSSLKWPIEAMFVGFRPVSNYDPTTTGTGDTYSAGKGTLQAWWRFAQTTYATTPLNGLQSSKLDNNAVVQLTAQAAITASAGSAAAQVALYVAAATVTPTLQAQVVVNTAAAAAATAGSSAATVFAAANPIAVQFLAAGPASLATLPATATLTRTSQTVDTLTISAHGIPLYNDFKTQFYNGYLPFTYGGYNINCPTDKGQLLVTFCLHPGTYQPSGHINISRAREFYLRYTSSVISSSNPCNLVVLASAINFLLISDGSAVLRYTT